MTFNKVVINKGGNSTTETVTVGSDCNLPLGNNPTLIINPYNTGWQGSLTLNGTLSGTGILTISNTGGGQLTVNSTGIISGFSGLNSANGITVSGTTVDFSAYTTFNLTDPGAVNTITLSSAATLKLPTPSGSITVNGINTSGNSTLLAAGGNIANNGDLVINGGTFTAPGGNMTVGGANFTISGSPTFNANGGTVTLTGLYTQTLACNNLAFNRFAINRTGVSATRTVTVGSDCNLPFGSNPTLIINPYNAGWQGNLTVNGTITGTGTLTISNTGGGQLTVNSTGIISGFTGLNSANGITVSGTTADFSSYTTFNLTDPGGVNTLTVASAGTLKLPTPSGSITVTGMSVTGVSTFIAGGGNITNNGDLIISGGSFTAPGGNMTTGGANFTISGSPVFNANGGTVTLTGLQNQTLACNSVPFNRFAINRTGVSATRTVTVGSDCNLPFGSNPTLIINPYNTGWQGNLTVNGTITGTGTLTISNTGGGQLTINSTGVVSGFTGLNSTNGISVSGTTVDFSGYTTFNLTDPGAVNTFTVAAGGILKLPTPSGSVTVTGMSITGVSTFTAGGGSITNNGSLIITGGTFTAPSGTMTLGGSNLTISGNPVFNANGGTISLTGLQNQTLACNSVPFNRFAINRTGVSASRTVTVGSDCNLPFGSNPTLVINPYSTGYQGGLILNGTITGTGVLTISNTGGGQLTINSTGVVSGFTGLNSTNGITVSGAIADFSGYSVFNLTDPGAVNTLTVAAAGTLKLPTPSGSITVTGISATGASTFIAAGGNITNNSDLTISGGTFTAPSGNMTVGGSSFTISGNPAFNANGGTVTLSGIVNQTLSCNNIAFNSFAISRGSVSATRTVTVGSDCNLPLGNNPTIAINNWSTGYQGNLTLNGTINGTGTLTISNVGGGQVTINSSGVISGFSGLSSTNGITVSGTTADFSGYSVFNLTDPGAVNTLTMVSAGILKLPTPSGSITVTGMSVTGVSTFIAAGGNIANNGDLIITGGNFTAPSGNMTMGGANFTISGNPTFSANGGTITLSGQNNQTLTCNNVTFSKFGINKTGVSAVRNVTVGSDCNLPMGNNPSLLINNWSSGYQGNLILNGTLSGTGTLAINNNPGIGSLTINPGAAILGFSGLSSATVGLTIPGSTVDFSSYGTFNLGGTVSVSSGTLTMPNGGTIGALTITGGTVAATTGDLTVTGAVSITTGTLSAPTGNLNIGGNFAHVSGTFNHNGGTVVMNGASQTFSGLATTFNNLTKIVPSATSQTLTFPSGVIETVTGTLTLSGFNPANRLLLRSSSGGTQWKIDPQGTRNLTFVDIKDANNVNATTVQVSDSGSWDSLNNTNFNIVATGPVAWWKMDEPSGTVVADSSGNGFTGTATGTGITTGQLNNARTFTISNAYVQVPDNSTIRDSVNISASAWVYLNAYDLSGTQSTLVAKYDNSTNSTIDYGGFLLGVNPSGAALATIMSDTINVNSSVTSGSTTIPLHVWTMVSMSYASGSSLKIYVNGILAGTTNSPVVKGTTVNALEIGRLSNRTLANYPYTHTNGTIDDVRIYSRALSDGDVSGIFDSALGSPQVSALGPANLVDGSPTANTQPTLTFNVLAGSSSLVQYQIQIGTDPTFTTNLVNYTSALGAQGDLSFTVGQATSGGTYTTGSPGQSLASGNHYWRVRAMNDSGQTGIYATAHGGAVAFVEPVAPGVPTGLTGVIGGAQVALTWAAPASNGGSAITDYQVEYKLSSDSSWTVFADGVTPVSTAIVTSLTNGLSYDFRISAINIVGPGSASSTYTTTPFTVPDAPVIDSVTPGNAQVTVDFTAGNSNGSAISSYTVTSSPGNKTATGSGSPLTVTTLTNGTTYTFTVKATNGAGQSPASIPSSPVVPFGVPSAPVSLAGTRGLTQIALSWSVPASDGGGAITDYLVEYKLTSSGTYLIFDDGVSAATGATVTGLVVNSNYNFRVSAINPSGAGATASVTVSTASVPSAPGSLSATPGVLQVGLTWNAPANNGDAITDYLVEYKLTSSGTYLTFADGVGTSTTATVTGLTQSASYNFRVSAINGVGTGTGATTSATVLGVPGVPTALSAVSGNKQASLTWNAPASNGGSPITDYLVEYRLTSFGTYSTFDDGISTTPNTVVTGLDQGGNYTFRVSAVNASGTGAPSVVATATVLDVPGSPSSLSAVVGENQVQLTWGAPAGNGGSALTDYIIEYKLSSDTDWLVYDDGVSLATSLVVPDLVNGSNYDFRVSAVNAIGTGSPSGTAAVFVNLAPNDPTALGPANVISAIVVPSLRPVFTFTQTDPNPTDTVRFRIQIDDNSDYSSPVADYSSALAPQAGVKTFTVGQAAGTGTYTTGASGQYLTSGNYYWRVISTDNYGFDSGYAEGNGALVAFIIDSQPPNAFTPTLNVTSPTTNRTPTVTFNTTDNVAVDHYDVKVDNGAFSTQLSPYTLPRLDEGDRTITVRAYDTTTNYTDGTVQVTIIVHPPAPFTPTLNVPAPTNNNAPIVSFETTDEAGIDHYELKLDSGTFATQTSPYQLPVLQQGSHTVTVRAFNITGDTTDGVLTFIVDTTPPFGFTPHLDVGSFTTNQRPILTFVTNDNLGFSHFEVQIDSGSFSLQSSPYVLPTLSDAAHTITVKAFDLAGNTRIGTLVHVTVDTIPPDPFVPTLDVSSPTNNTRPAVSFSATDNIGVDHYQVKVDSGAFATQVSPYQVDALVQGDHTITVRAFDETGNFRDGSVVNVTVDENGPDAFTPTFNFTGTFTNDQRPVLSFSATDNIGVDHYEVKVDSSAFTVQTSPYQLPLLLEGVHVAKVRAYDTSNNYTEETLNFTVDLTAPDDFNPFLISGVHTSDTTPTLAFGTHDNYGISHYDVQIDNGPFTIQVSQYQLPPQANGNHSIVVRAFDYAGNFSNGTIVNFNVDTIAPEPFTPTLNVTSPTINTTPVLSFFTTDNEGVTDYLVKIDNNSYSQRTSPYQLPVLADGDRVLTVRAYDAANNYREEQITLTIDRTPPDPFTPTINNGNPSNNAAPLLSFSTTDHLGIDHYEVKIDNGPFSVQTSPYQMPVLSETNRFQQPHTIRVRAFNVIGTSTDGVLSLQIDTSLPVVNISSPTLIKNSAITDTTITISDNLEVNLTDVAITGATPDCRQYNSYVITCTTVVSSTGTLSVTATDTAINTRTATVPGYVIDNILPVVTITAPTKTSVSTITDTTLVVTDNVQVTTDKVVAVSGGSIICLQKGQTRVECTASIADSGDLVINVLDTAGNAVAKTEPGYVVTSTPPAPFTPTLNTTPFTTNTAPILFFSTTDSDGIDHYEVKVDNGSFAPQLSPYQMPVLAAGFRMITVRAYDSLGNFRDASIGLTVQTSSPNSFTPILNVGSPTNNPTPQVTFFTTDSNGINHYEVQVDSGSFTTQVSPYTLPALAEGDHVITVRAFNNVDNSTDGSVNLTVDLTAPAAFTPLVAPIVNTNTPTVTFVTTDNLAIGHYEVKIDNFGFITSASPYTSPSLSEGDHSVTVKAFDTAGNSTTGSANFTIDITQPSAFNLTLNVTSPTNNPTPTVTFATTDNVAISHYDLQIDSGAFSTQTSPYTTSVLSDGVHHITVVAYDTAGNTQSASAQIVVDTTPPVITHTVPTLIGVSSITDTTISVSDNYSISQSGVSATGGGLTCSQTSGSQVDCTTEITASGDLNLTATDTAGNTSTDTVSGYQLDAIAPVITINAPTKISDTTITDTTVSITDNLALNSFAVQATGGTLSCVFVSISEVNCQASIADSGDLNVNAIDTAGNRSDLTEADYVVGNDAPEAFTPTLNTGSYTSNKTPIVSYLTTSEYGISHYDVKVDGGEFSTQISPYQLPELTEGFHSITVRAFGNNGVFRDGVVNVTIDTIVPDPFKIILDVKSPTNDDTPTITFATRDNIAISHYEVKTDASAFTTQNSPYTLPKLLQGSHKFTVNAVDLAGNKSTATADLLIDTEAPADSIRINDDAAETKSKQVDLKIHATDNLTGVVYMKISQNKDLIGSLYEPFSATKQIVLDGTEGQKTVYIKFRDGANNESATFSDSIKYVVSPVNVVVPTKAPASVLLPALDSIAQASPVVLTLTTAATVLTSFAAYPSLLQYGGFIIRSGIRKRRHRASGVVYDELTRTPVAFAMVRLYDDAGKLVAERVSDLGGRYGFVIEKGSYRITAEHSAYTKFEDEFIFKSEEGAFARDIALSHRPYNKNSLRNQISRKFGTINKILVYGGFSYSILSLVLLPNLLHGAMFGLYVGQAGVAYILGRSFRREWGYLYNNETKERVKGFVRVYDVEQGRQVDVMLTGEMGRYAFNLPSGKYLVRVDADGYKFPSAAADENQIFNGPTGQKFLQVNLEKGKPINLSIPLDREG